MWFNNFVIPLLKSPLHFFMSGNTMLVTYTGDKSGRPYTTPVNYWQVDSKLYSVSNKDRVWWRNMREPDHVKLVIRGEEKQAIAAAHEDPGAVLAHLTNLLAVHPQIAKYFKVATDPDGLPDPDALQAAVKDMVVIVSELQE